MSLVVFTALLIAGQGCLGPFSADGSHMGPVVIGQSVASLSRLGLPVKRVIVADDGGEHPQYRLTVCPGMVIEAEADEADKTISLLSTRSSGFVTAAGAHTGMTLSQLQMLYPAGRLHYSDVEGNYAAFVTPTGVAFALDTLGIPLTCFTAGRGCDTLFRRQRAVEMVVRDDR